MDLQGNDKDKITPAIALDLMGDFYNKVKFDGLSDNPDSDMLLSQ
jgi:hypothetical protein